MPQLHKKVFFSLPHFVGFSIFQSLQILTWGFTKLWMFRYTALDALRLVSTEDEYFHCESCNGELVAESDKLAAQEMGDGDDNARRRRREKLKDMLQKLEVLVLFLLLDSLLINLSWFLCEWFSVHQKSSTKIPQKFLTTSFRAIILDFIQRLQYMWLLLCWYVAVHMSYLQCGVIGNFARGLGKVTWILMGPIYYSYCLSLMPIKLKDQGPK